MSDEGYFGSLALRLQNVLDQIFLFAGIISAFNLTECKHSRGIYVSLFPDEEPDFPFSKFKPQG